MGAVSRDRLGRSGWVTAARARGQRPSATSEKSISARSLRPREMSRFRRPMSISMHSTRLPSRARQEATPPVTEVLPVPPFPEVTAMTIPMEFLLSHQNKSITNLGFVNVFFVIWCEFSVYFVFEFEVWAGYGTERVLTAEPSGSWPTGGDTPSGWGPPFGWE